MPSNPVVLIKSGPAVEDLPYRYGCSCGAIWNASAPLTDQKALCGPFCSPSLFVMSQTRPREGNDGND